MSCRDNLDERHEAAAAAAGALKSENPISAFNIYSRKNYVLIAFQDL
jgi:hypothetical protein